MLLLPKNVNHNSTTENNYPSVGVVLKVNGQDYFAPLAADKNLKYRNVANPTIFKLVTPNNNYLGVIKLNNMIPVPKDQVHTITPELLNSLGLGYQKLLNSQRNIIKKNAQAITEQAARLYQYVVKDQNLFFCSISAKFTILELACNNYCHDNQTQF